MKPLSLQVLAAPLLLAACTGAMMLRQPTDNVAALSTSMGEVYTAPVLSASPAPLSTVPPGLEPIASTPGLPPKNPPSTAAPLHGTFSAGDSFDVRSRPTISPQLIDRVLASYGSPMAGEGKQLYDLGVKYGIDPAFCLAFFIHESAAGTRGEAVLTHNLGNIRSVPGAPALDGYHYYDTWLEGAEAWYQLISTAYVHNWGLTTVASIIPVYAPSGDSNDPTSYINDVEQLVSTWRAQSS